MELQKILLVKNGNDGKGTDASLLLCTYFGQMGIECDLMDTRALIDEVSQRRTRRVTAGEYLLAVVLGGDGTILRTATYLEGSGTPILGINFGHLGFLSNPADDGVVAIVAAALSGDVTEENRSNVCATVHFEGEAEDAPGQTYFALNEITVERGFSGRVVDMSVLCGGKLAYTSRGNGMVVASATGSTAYALSAGGPMVSPETRGLIVVPLVPHTLSSRAMVTAPGEVVELVLTEDPEHNDVRLFIDGRPLVFDKPVRSVVVENGAVPTKLLRYKHNGFYADIARVFFREE